MDEYDPEGADEPRYLICSNLIACHNIGYDNTNVDAGYSLNGVLVHVRPDAGMAFPIVVARQWLFAQLHGTPDEYIVRVRQVQIVATEEGGEREVEITEFGPWEISLPDDNYVECFGFALTGVQYPEAGVYEFQLWVDGFDGYLGRERLKARE